MPRRQGAFRRAPPPFLPLAAGSRSDQSRRSTVSALHGDSDEFQCSRTRSPPQRRAGAVTAAAAAHRRGSVRSGPMMSCGPGAGAVAPRGGPWPVPPQGPAAGLREPRAWQRCAAVGPGANGKGLGTAGKTTSLRPPTSVVFMEVYPGRAGRIAPKATGSDCEAAEEQLILGREIWIQGNFFTGSFRSGQNKSFCGIDLWG